MWFSLADNPSCLGQNALPHDWPKVLLYIFPCQFVTHVSNTSTLQEGHGLLLVAPFQLVRTQFNLLHKLCNSSTKHYPPRKDLPQQLTDWIVHSNPNCLQLGVWPLQEHQEPCQRVEK